jgi:hypothetical protein
MTNVTTPKINNPQNFKSSNTLVTTRKPHYATKVNTAFNIVPGMHRPNANNTPSNIIQRDFIGPDFKARPLKHWRRQLVPTNLTTPKSDNSTQKRMSMVQFMDTPGLTVYKTNADTCNCINGNNGPVIIDIYTEIPGIDIIITDIEYADDEPTVPDIVDIEPRTQFIEVPFSDGTATGYNQDNAFEIADAYNDNKIRSGTQIQNNGQINIPTFYIGAPVIEDIYDDIVRTDLILEMEYNDEPTVPDIVYIEPRASFDEIPDSDQNPGTNANANENANANANADMSYNIYTGVYETVCIACNPENNIIKSGIATLSQAYYGSISQYLESRCRTYAQRESTTKKPNGIYYPSKNHNTPFVFLYPDNDPHGPQVYQSKNCANPKIYNNNQLNTPNNYCSTIYKPNNPQFAQQGAVSGSNRIQKLKSDTITNNGFSFYSAYGATMANAGNFQGTSESNNYYVKNRNYPLTAFTSLEKYRQNKVAGCCVSVPILQPPIGAPTIEDIYNSDVPGTVIIIDIEYAGNEPTVPDIVNIEFI